VNLNLRSVAGVFKKDRADSKSKTQRNTRAFWPGFKHSPKATTRMTNSTVSNEIASEAFAASNASRPDNEGAATILGQSRKSKSCAVFCLSFRGLLPALRQHWSWKRLARVQLFIRLRPTVWVICRSTANLRNITRMRCHISRTAIISSAPLTEGICGAFGTATRTRTKHPRSCLYTPAVML